MTHCWRQVLSRQQPSCGCARAILLIAALALVGGCGALSPAFVDFALPAEYASTETARGHIPIYFLSNAQFDTELLQYFAAIGLDVSDPNLRPRIRVIAEVRFSDGSSRNLEFLDGSDINEMVAFGENEGAFVSSDLTSAPLTNQVVQCDVTAIVVRPEDIEVYVPISITEYTWEEVENVGMVRRYLRTYPPRFWPLRVDDVDENLNVVTTRNLGIRDAPGPLLNVTCGSVIMFALEGALRVPFVGGIPSWDDDDTLQIAVFPGRYRVITAVR